MKIKKFFELFTKIVVEVEVNAQKYDWRTVYQLERVLRSFRFCLSKNESYNNRDHIKYIFACLQKAKTKVAEYNNKADIKLGILENELFTLRKRNHR